MDVRAREAQATVKVEGAHELPRTRPSPMPKQNPKPVQLWPFCVKFGDIDDAKTVKEVNPSSLGVRRITIEITDEDVTTGIEEKLLYGRGNSEYQKWRRSLPFTDFRRQLSRSNFLAKEK